MSDGVLRIEGNLRLMSLPLPQHPPDLAATCQQVDDALNACGAAAYGPLVLLYSWMDDDTPDLWPCQVGRACTGLVRPTPPLVAEDFCGLQSLSLPHHGDVGELPLTRRRLQDQARAHGWSLRPYWRLAVHREPTSDGSWIPRCEVSVFLDR